MFRIVFIPSLHHLPLAASLSRHGFSAHCYLSFFVHVSACLIGLMLLLACMPIEKFIPLLTVSYRVAIGCKQWQLFFSHSFSSSRGVILFI